MKLSEKELEKAMTLYAVTDRSWLEGKSLAPAVEEAVKGGVPFLQLREKDLPKEEFLKLALEIKGVCKRYNVPFVINDDVDIALKSGADGVHVGQDDMAALKAREILGKDAIIGVSVHNLKEAEKAFSDGADYLGVGAVFSTSTKKDAENVPFETLREICQKTGLPVVAIGGINSDNIEKLKGSGIKGVAVVSAIFASKDIEGASSQLLGLAKEL